MLKGLWGEGGRDGVGWRWEHSRVAWSRRRFADARAGTGMGDIDRSGLGLASKSHRDAGVGLRSSHVGYEEESERRSVCRAQTSTEMSQSRSIQNAITPRHAIGGVLWNDGWRRWPGRTKNGK
jgi:hypothetical protein